MFIQFVQVIRNFYFEILVNIVAVIWGRNSLNIQLANNCETEKNELEISPGFSQF